jgi:hypothetical protein
MINFAKFGEIPMEIPIRGETIAGTAQTTMSAIFIDFTGRGHGDEYCHISGFPRSLLQDKTKS